MEREKVGGDALDRHRGNNRAVRRGIKLGQNRSPPVASPPRRRVSDLRLIEYHRKPPDYPLIDGQRAFLPPGSELQSAIPFNRAFAIPIRHAAAADSAEAIAKAEAEHAAR